MKFRLSLILFTFLILFAGTLGLTEDEAYYWILSQKLSLGYAFHPPGVAWFIRFFEVIFAPFVGRAVPWVTRFPAVFITVVTLLISQKWIRRAGGLPERIEGAGLVLLSFAGMFAVSWMMVPDLPLLLGWIICFFQIWKRCFEKEVSSSDDLALFVGTVIAVLSKYTAVFIFPSAFLCLMCFSERATLKRSMIVLILGGCVGFLPNFIWNAQHHFGPLLYQLSERHSGSHFVLSRYLRFWALQLVLAGPLLLFTGILFREAYSRKGIERFVVFWILPSAIVFWIQPAFSDFKFHWTLISWFPAALLLALKFAKMESLGWAKAQKIVGFSLMGIVFLLFQIPGTAWTAEMLGKSLDPKYDVTNDVYGWDRLYSRFNHEAPEALRALPWVGSRYQTAALAAYSLKDATRVEMIPRDEKSRDEWPSLGITNSPGPEWPEIRSPFIFVGDNRFSGVPEFKSGTCSSMFRFDFFRQKYLAKTINLYFCQPH